MELNFTVENLSITFAPPSEPTVNDSTNYVTAHFEFTGSPWDKATAKTAVFHQLNKAYSVILNNDSCFVPFEVLKNGGFAVGVMTSFEEDGILKTVYTKMCIVSTAPSCYSESFNNPEVTPSQYEQIMAFLKSGAGAIEAIKVNGETLIITDKSVDIFVPTKTSDLVNDSNFVNLAMLNEALSFKQNAVPGKGLSSNDYTYEDKAKLESVEIGAQINAIEKISVNGTEAEVSEKGVDISVPTKISDLQNDSGFTKALRFTNTSVSPDSFVPDTTFDDYPYKSDITLSGVTENDYANVIFSLSDVQSKNFAPVCTTGENTVTVYAAEAPGNSLTIPLIEVVKV